VRLRKADGFALIDLVFVCGIIGLLSSIAIPRMLLARQVANAASAISTMRAINSGELSYALSCGLGFYAPTLTILGTPPVGTTEAYISPDLSSAATVVKSNYIIQLDATAYAGAPATCNGLAGGLAGRSYRAAADPTEPTNTRFFATNAQTTVWEDSSTLWAVMPETGEPASGHPLR